MEMHYVKSAARAKGKSSPPKLGPEEIVGRHLTYLQRSTVCCFTPPAGWSSLTYKCTDYAEFASQNFSAALVEDINTYAAFLREEVDTYATYSEQLSVVLRLFLTASFNQNDLT